MVQSEPKHGDIVVALDFGTTRTAVAYSVVGGTDKLINVLPPGRAGSFVIGDPKTPTSLLMKGNQTIEFGYRAEERFAECGDDELKWRLFRMFKMALHNSHTPDPQVQSVGDRGSFPLSRILMESLMYLKENTLQYLKGTNVLISGNLDDVFWVLTLPAIWSQYAKGMMRKAAFKAGMISDENSNRLMLALEPECAAVASEMWGAGTRFMIADCGGGTLDITSHEVVESSPLKLKEIGIPSGGPFGAKQVDEKFFDFLANFLGRDKYDQLVKDHTSDYFDLLTAWERKKVQFDFDPYEDEWTDIKLPGILIALRLTSEDLAAMVESWNSAHLITSIKPIRKNKTSISLSLELMKSFFAETVSNILDKVTFAAVELDDLKYVVLAGGFGRCSLIELGLLKALHTSSITVICAKEPDLCIVKGAVMFGCARGGFVTSRKSRYTFGIAASVKFDPNSREHIKNKDEKYTAEGEERLDIFNVHGRVGDDLSCLDHPRLFYKPMALDQGVISVRILVTEEHDVFLEYGPGVHTFCTTKIYLGDMMELPYEDRGVWVDFSFGGPEVRCCVFDTTGEKELENFVVDFKFF